MAERETFPSVEAPKLLPLIVIDPGHGGKDHGTESTKKPSYTEKSLTLDTAHYLQKDLRRLGFRTLMTRESDLFVPLEERSNLANQMGAKLFVSVHYNSAPATSASGVEVFYYQGDKETPRSAASKKLASSVLNEVTEETRAKSRGIKKGNFAVIRETKMPAVLVECGFLTNSGEQSRILTKEYRKRLALGIAKGIDHYLKK